MYAHLLCLHSFCACPAGVVHFESVFMDCENEYFDESQEPEIFEYADADAVGSGPEPASSSASSTEPSLVKRREGIPLEKRLGVLQMLNSGEPITDVARYSTSTALALALINHVTFQGRSCDVRFLCRYRNDVGDCRNRRLNGAWDQFLDRAISIQRRSDPSNRG